MPQNIRSRVFEFAHSRKIPISLFCPDVERARRGFAQGYTLVPVATDGLLLVRGAASLVKTVRET